MTYWRTKVSVRHSEGYITSDFITFMRGIFQGDTFSPLIFCLCLAPITNILKRKDIGYKINGTKVSNVFYIDDLKVYAKDAKQMEKCRALIEEFSSDIKMSFGLDKCAVIHLKKVKQATHLKPKESQSSEKKRATNILGLRKAAQSNTLKLLTQRKRNTSKEYEASSTRGLMLRTQQTQSEHSRCQFSDMVLVF